MKKVFLLLITGTFLISSCENIHPSQIKTKKATQIAQKFLIDQKIPGMAISISQKRQLIWSKGFGYSNVEKKEKVNPKSTQFRIASISKTLTAVALAKLVDQGNLTFDASIYSYIPDFPKKKYDFSVRQVAGHVAGIRHYKDDEFLLNKKMSIVEGLDIFKNDDLLFEPGTTFKYSTYGWNLLSVVVQNAAQKDYIQFMTDEIFTPLKMKNTLLDVSDKTLKNRTSFYIKRKGNILIAPKVSNEFKAAGGGFIATSEDLILFGNEILNPTIISASSVSELVKPLHTTTGKSTKYGIGIKINHVKNNTLRYSHSGGGMGATAYLLIYPEKELVISILTNLSGVKIRELVAKMEDIFIE